VSELVKQVELSIASKRLIRRGESILVAVSGGLDSMVLLRVLAELAARHRWNLAVAHFNHRLRGRSSDADERVVNTAAKRLKLPFVRAAGDVKEYSREHGLSLEMAGRKLRHGFLAKAAAKRGIKTIALAHHADDQVELFFLRLLRGAGSEGLAGMKWRSASPANQAIDLIRPMLDRAKDELKRYAEEAGVVFREDATNAQLDMQRNRIRRELIPLLTTRYQPALRRVVLREMEMLGAEAEFMDYATLDWLKAGKGFEKLPVALQRHCLQAQLRELGVPGSFGLIEELRDAANSPITVSETRRIYRDTRGKLHAQEINGSLFGKRQKQIALNAKGEVVFDKRRIWWSIRPIDTGTFRAGKGVANCECFDVKKTGKLIILRHWRPGDRFQPLGMAFPVKLQDLFTNRKVPRVERHRRIVATTEKGEIFWVEGLRMAEHFKLDKKTTDGLKWEWQGV
jgi:tRNA(Ile)-lysidine synthase